jgi:hypothetical protein
VTDRNDKSVRRIEFPEPSVLTVERQRSRKIFPEWAD